MKTAFVTTLAAALIVTAAGLSVPTFAVEEHHATPSAQTSAEARMVEGLVKKVDKSAGKATIAHGPLPNLGMPAMTMVFRVKDPAWLDQMQAGEKIRFVADKVNGAFTVVQFEAVR